MGTFDDELERKRAERSAEISAGEKARKIEEERRAAICDKSREAANQLLGDVYKAAEALQARAGLANRYSTGFRSGLRVDFKYRRFRRKCVERWDFGGICVPRRGRPYWRVGTLPRKSRRSRKSLEEFANEAHQWWTTTDRSTGTVTRHERDAAEVFRKFIEQAAQYIAELESRADAERKSQR